MGYSTTSVPFMDIATVGQVVECSIDFGHLMSKYVTVETVVGYRQARFALRDDKPELHITFDNGDFVILELV